MAPLLGRSQRQANLAKHGFDFADAAWVLDSEIRMDAMSVQGDEARTVSFAYVFEVLAVLLLVHAERDGDEVRVISFRRASREEREVYHEWLEANDP